MCFFKILLPICINTIFVTTVYSQSNTLIKSSSVESDSLKSKQIKNQSTGAISHIDDNDFNVSICKNTPLQLVQNKLTGLMMSLPNSSDPTNMEVEFAIRGINSFYANKEMLYIIDGVPASITSIAFQDIKSFTLLRSYSSINQYGSLSNGPVIVIETKKAVSNKLTINYLTQLSVEKFAKYADVLSSDEYLKTNNSTDYGYSTDWFDKIMQKSFNQQHFVSAGIGSQQIKAYSSFSYRKMDGVVKKSDNQEVKCFLNIEANAINNRLTINLSSRLNRTKANPTNFQVLEQAIKYNPTQRPYDDEGNYNSSSNYQYYNPVNLINESDLQNKLNENFVKGYIGFKISDNWSLHTNTSVSHSDNDYSEIYNGNYEINNRSAIESSSCTIKNNKSSIYFDVYSKFSKTIDRHVLEFIAGYKNQKNEIKSKTSNLAFYRNPEYSYSNIGGDSSKYHNSLFFGNVNYSFNNKYIADIAISYNKSDNYLNKTAIDPSMSIAWVVSNEEFLKKVRIINELKLSVEYGVKTLTSNINGNYRVGNLNDEKTTELNIGIEWALFGTRLNGSFDYYTKKNTNSLSYVLTPVPPYYYPYAMDNSGSIENKGIEIGLRAIPVKTKNLTWIVYINYSTNKNKVLFGQGNNSYYSGDTGEPIKETTHQVTDGQPVGNFYGYKSVDIDENGVWIIENSKGDRISINYATSNDMEVIGNGIPKHYLGIANTFQYKKFDFSFNLRGAFGFQALNYQRMFYENPNTEYNKLTSSNDLVYGKEILKSNLAYVSYYIEDGDYLKIDNLALGYTTPIKKGISLLRVYLSAQNVYTFTKYKGIDPELSINYTNPGCEQLSVYPRTAIFTLGFNLTF